MQENLELKEERSKLVELGRLERRYQQLVQGLDAIVWEAEAESFAFTFVSDRAEQLLGYPIERWLAEPDLFGKILHPEDRAETLTRSRSAAAAGLDYEADFRMMAADGRTLWFHQVVRVLSDAFGVPREVRGVMIDVTRLRESVETVRVQAELLDEISAAVCAVDPKGVVLYWNRQAEDMFGWSRGEALGSSIGELGLIGAGPQNALELRDALLAGGRWEGEVSARHRDGSNVPLYLRGSGVRGPGDEACVLLGIAIDAADARGPYDGLEARAQVLDGMGAAVIATDLGGRVVYWNAKAHELYGWSADEAGGRRLLDLLVADAWRPAAEAAAAERGPDEAWEGDLQVRGREGEELTVWVRETPIRDGAGEVVGHVAVSLDVSPYGGSTQALATSEAVREAILDASLDCIITIDHEGMVTDFNPAAEATFGYTRDEAVGARLAELVIPERLRDAHAEGLARNVATGEGRITGRRVELIAMRAGGEEFPVELTVARIDVPGPPQFAGFVRDISERRRTEDRIAELANRDQLTGLANRRLLRDHLELSIPRTRRRGTVLALLHVDIERFALVNDTIGRSHGDEVLRAVGARLDALDKVEVVARDAGDEFLVAAELEPSSRGIQDGGASAVAQVLGGAVIDAFAEPFEVGGEKVPLVANVGISLLPLDAHDVDTMLEHADAAVREAQGARGGIVIFKPRGGDARARLSLATSLRGALDRDEFQLHYQPVVDLRSVWDARKGGVTDLHGATVGVEALIRWRHPQHGLVAPGQFIPMLDDNGLIHRVGGWVVEEVCRQVKDWRALGLRFETAFNISLRELAEPGLLERLVEETDRAGVDRRTLVAEITETATMADPDRIEKVLRGLSDAGFHLAIDDFGTGHSSLARLWRMPVRTLKIDRSFIAALLSDPAAGTMVTTIVRMAEGLGIRTLAEGIETEEQLRFLVTHGCNLGQGYLFSRPVPAPELTKLCSKR
jgi:PAS domain S-box-containing protein/diguanylate cyclase (GGDEF)-like protein